MNFDIGNWHVHIQLPLYFYVLCVFLLDNVIIPTYTSRNLVYNTMVILVHIYFDSEKSADARITHTHYSVGAPLNCVVMLNQTCFYNNRKNKAIVASRMESGPRALRMTMRVILYTVLAICFKRDVYNTVYVTYLVDIYLPSFTTYIESLCSYIVHIIFDQKRLEFSLKYFLHATRFGIFIQTRSFYYFFLVTRMASLFWILIIVYLIDFIYKLIMTKLAWMSNKVPEFDRRSLNFSLSALGYFLTFWLAIKK